MVFNAIIVSAEKPSIKLMVKPCLSKEGKDGKGWTMFELLLGLVRPKPAALGGLVQFRGHFVEVYASIGGQDAAQKLV